MTPISIRALSVLLFGAVLASHVNGHMGCADSRWSIPTAVSFIDQGNFDLDEYAPILKARGPAFLEQVRGHTYTVYPFGTSVLAAPIVMVLRPLARLAWRLWPSLGQRMEYSQGQVRLGCPPVVGEPVIGLHSWTEQITASTIVATATVVMFAIALNELPPAGAAMFALLFAFGTSAWSTASRSLWQHGPSMLMLSLALLVQLRQWPLIFMGLTLAFAYAVRPTNLVPLALGTAWVAFEHPRRLWLFAAGAAIVLVPFFLNNYHVYGAWLSPYYRGTPLQGVRFFRDALAGGLISPGRGLLVYSPVFVFAAAGVVLKIRDRSFRSLDLLLIASLCAHAIATAWLNSIWWGGYSYGPRFYADVVPYLMYFLIPVFVWIGRPKGAARWIVAALVAIAALASVAIHAQGVFSVRATAWNVNPDDINQNPGRLWDWRRPPFLAGWQADPAPFDITATPCQTPPGAPSDLELVSNSGGTLVGRWRPASGAVGEYVVESGSASGLSDFPDRETHGPQPGVTAYRVPPGTYYSRVRARNSCGTSPPSNEVTIVVK